jgi:2-hydroxy-3-keto-5-methylthiopentenyl-1-phosphate phosphatase
MALAASYLPDDKGSMDDWVVLCDFDGTVSTDVTDSLLLRFGRRGWESLESDWREGRIGSRQCMSGQVALLDCSLQELEEHLAGVTIDPEFPAFVASLRESGVPLCIVSDGLDLAITSILSRHDVAGIPVHASRLEQTGFRSWALDVPPSRGGCDSAVCKCSFAGKSKLPHGRKVLVIGDGDSDVCVAGQADMVFARSRLLAHCQALDLPHRRTEDFAQVRQAWRTLNDPLACSGSSMARESLDV